MNMDKLKEVFSEEAFVKALFEMEAVAEMRQALREKGVELSEEEVAGLRDFFAKVKGGEISREQLEEWSKLAENGELSEETLEQVAGGIEPITVMLLVGLLGGVLPIGIGISLIDIEHHR